MITVIPLDSIFLKRCFWRCKTRSCLKKAPQLSWRLDWPLGGDSVSFPFESRRLIKTNCVPKDGAFARHFLPIIGETSSYGQQLSQSHLRNTQPKMRFWLLIITELVKNSSLIIKRSTFIPFSSLRWERELGGRRSRSTPETIWYGIISANKSGSKDVCRRKK